MDLKKWSPWNWFRTENESEGSGVVPVANSTSMGFPVTRLHQEIDRMFEDFFRGSNLFPSLFDTGKPLIESQGFLKPRVDISENAEHYIISVEVPGVDEKDIHVDLEGDTLTIRGEKKQQAEEKKDKYHRVERSYGSFQRVLSLPGDANTEQVKAKFKNGILTINVGRSGESKSQGRRIEVQKV